MLRQGNCVKVIDAAASGEFTVQTGRSVLIKQLYVDTITTATTMTFRTDRKTVGHYRISGKSGNHLSLPLTGYHHKNLMEVLGNAGAKVTLPIAEGQTFSFIVDAGSARLIVIYDQYDAGDIHAGMPNGSESDVYTMIQYMDASTYPSADGDIELDTSLSPSEFIDFPCGKVVPPRTKVKLLGLVGSPVYFEDGDGDSIMTTHCKIVRDREVLFDDDRLGFPFEAADGGSAGTFYNEGGSIIHPCTPVIMATGVNVVGDPLLFDPVLVFMPGEELKVSLTFDATLTPTGFSTGIDFAAIMEVSREL